MESKLLVGGKSIVDKTTEQEKALEQRKKDILKQKVCMYICIQLYVIITKVILYVCVWN